MKGKLLFADAEEVRRCRDDGLSWKIIAKNLGTNVNTLREWRKINQFDVSAAISRQ
jgi:DNA-binding transcriptional regulator YiaG